MRAYNPLSVDELGKNAVRALMDYPADALPRAKRSTVLAYTRFTTLATSARTRIFATSRSMLERLICRVSGKGRRGPVVRVGSCIAVLGSIPDLSRVQTILALLTSDAVGLSSTRYGSA